MELILGFVIVVVALALFDLAALRWGVNSRRAGGDWNQPGEVDYYEADRFGTL
jgi:hypothetical protein